MENFCKQQWHPSDYNALTTYLLSLQDLDYRAFHQKLIPDVTDFIGVRTPHLKALAKVIVQGNVTGFLKESCSDYYELRMLEGLVIGLDRKSPEQFWQRAVAFIPKIDNWAICDSFCAAAKILRKDLAGNLPNIDQLLLSSSPWSVRAGLVLLLDHYLTPEWIDEVLCRCALPFPQHYYIQMGLAWLLSICYVKFEEKTLVFLEDFPLDEFTYQKALQKIIESNRVTPAQKEQIRQMKQAIRS